MQLEKDCPNEEEGDDLGIYEIVFGPPSMAAVSEECPSQILDQTQEKDCILEQNPQLGSEMEDPIVEENKVSSKPEIPRAAVMEEKRLENFLKILDEFERLASNVEEKKMKKKRQEPPPRGAKSDKVVEKQKSLLMNGSEAADCNNNKSNNQIQTTNEATKLEESSATAAKSQSQRSGGADDRDNLSSYGSMRREREWKRTLACKLFEERHNAAAAGGGGGGEAMDSLWEAYEVDSEKLNKRRSEKVKRGKNVEREWEEDGAQLCCLQALKLSAGKMNLGVGKPNLVKISKAIKGIGWLHNLTKTSKKVHNNGDHRF